MKYTISLVIFGILISSCTQGTGIRNNETVLKIFTPEEAEELEKINTFFTKLICDSTTNSEPSVCYETFLNKMKAEVPSTGAYPVLCSKEDQDRFFDGVDSSLFSQIWTWNKVFGPDDNDWFELGIINYRKYGEFLELLGEKSEPIREYIKDLKFYGILTVSIQNSVLLNPEKFDLTDECVRLFISIHYLTVCHQSKNY